MHSNNGNEYLRLTGWAAQPSKARTVLSPVANRPLSFSAGEPWDQQSFRAASMGEVTPSLTPSSPSYPLLALPPSSASKGLPVFDGVEITVKGAHTQQSPQPHPLLRKAKNETIKLNWYN